MEKVKKFKKPLIITLCFLVVACALFVVSEVTAVRIDDIENYEDIFTDVEKLQFYRGSDNFFTTVSPAKKLRSLKSVKIKSEPVSEERIEEKDSAYKFTINDKYSVYINADFSELWVDDMNVIKTNTDNSGADTKTDEGRLTSYAYAVRNPGVLKKLFVDTKKYYD